MYPNIQSLLTWFWFLLGKFYSWFLAPISLLAPFPFGCHSGTAMGLVLNFLLHSIFFCLSDLACICLYYLSICLSIHYPLSIYPFHYLYLYLFISSHITPFDSRLCFHFPICPVTMYGRAQYYPGNRQSEYRQRTLLIELIDIYS